MCHHAYLLREQTVSAAHPPPFVILIDASPLASQTRN
jgi:hypothetical protein